MTTFQRGLIELRIQQMEAGRFQEFVLGFLPLYDDKYKGIIRHGHTEFGKTRPGVPDLLKTFENGNQIGCECGTEDNYWVPPTDPAHFADWKPISDGHKCLAKMLRPEEIVLASSRALSGKHLNAKTLIIDHFSSRTPCPIKLLTSADFSLWIERNFRRAEVFQFACEFFPEATENAKLEAEKSTLSTAVDLGDKLGFPIKNILNAIKAAGDHAPELLEQEVTAALSTYADRFTLAPPNAFEGIKRVEYVATPLLEPHGSIIQVIGVPKIGKSHLCFEAIHSRNLNYTWFSVPNDPRLFDDFVDTILVAGYKVYLSAVEAAAKVRGWRKVDIPGLAPIGQSSLIIFIDNAHLLPKAILSRFDAALHELRTATTLRNLSFVILTNRNLSNDITEINSTVVAPPWTPSELRELINNRHIPIIDSNADEYFDILALQSCGHPLFAVALASKYPDRARLLLNSLEGPKQHDETLSKELTSVLYRDLLTDVDQQNFVQRLALLNGKADLGVVDSLRTKVVPHIKTTAHNLVENIGPAVLEGTLENGLSVNATFRNIAKTRIGPDESKQVYRVAAAVLLEIKSNTINADRYLDGIFYATLSGEIGRAAGHALFLLSALRNNDQEENNNRLRVILNRLIYWRLIDVHLENRDYLMVCSLRLMLGHKHAEIGESRESAEYFDKIDLSRLKNIDDTRGDIVEMKRYVVAAVISGRLLAIRDMASPTDVAISFLDYIDSKESLPVPLELRRIFPELIWRLPNSKLKDLNFASLSTRLSALHISELSDIAIFVGSAAVKNTELSDSLDKIDPKVGFGPALFRLIVWSSRCVNNAQEVEAKRLATEAIQLMRDHSRDPEDLGPRFYQHLADINYGMKNYNEAIVEYRKSSALARSEDDIIIGWNHFKIGLSSNDDDLILSSLVTAKKIYEAAGDYRLAGYSIGALIAQQLEMRRFKEAIEAACTLATWYHNDNRKEVGSSLRLVLAQVIGVISNLSGKELPIPKENCPPPDRKMFLKVPDSLRLESGAMTSYQMISQLAEAAGLEEEECRIIKLSLYSEVEKPIDRSAFILNWYRLYKTIPSSDVNPNETKLLLKRICQYQPGSGTKEEEHFLRSIFKPFEDRAISDPLTWGPILLMVVESVHEVIATMDDSVAVRWDLYLDYAEALANQLLGNKLKAYEHFRSCVRRGIAERKWNTVYNAAFRASFPLWDQHPSIYEAGRANYELLLCVSGMGLSQESVVNLGINLYRFWSSISWKRLKDVDFRVKEHLLDCASRLRESGFSEVEAAPVMVALLAKAFNHPEVLDKYITSSRILPEDVSKMLLDSNPLK